MKYKQSKNRKIKKITLAIILALILTLVLFYVSNYVLNTSKKSDDTTLQPNKDDSSDTSGDKNTPETKPTVDKDPVVSETTISISANSQNGDVYQIRTLINTVSSSGTCTLVLTQGEKTVTKSSNVQAGPSSSTCMGFDVPVSELGSGDWIMTVTFKDQNHHAEITKTIGVM